MTSVLFFLQARTMSKLPMQAMRISLGRHECHEWRVFSPGPEITFLEVSCIVELEVSINMQTWLPCSNSTAIVFLLQG